MVKSGSVNKVALYCRYAHKKSESDASVEQERRSLQAFCESRGYEVAGVYLDNGYSGMTLDNPSLQQLLSDLRDDRFDTVAIRTGTVLSRDIVKFIGLYVDEFLPRKKELLIMDLNSSMSDLLMQPLYSRFDEV